MKQAEKIYMISDAAKQIEVEAHVLRYWEEELRLPVKRNEMGHRYYTQEDIMQFRKIKELKEQGLQLKAIRSMLNNGILSGGTINSVILNGEMTEEPALDLSKRHVVMMKKGELLQGGAFSAVQEETREQKSLRLQQLLRDMIVEAVQNNNREVCQEIKESLLKELDYQFRLQEEREDIREEERIRKQEEHYKQIDELIRSYNQKGKSDFADVNAGKKFQSMEKRNRRRKSVSESLEDKNKEAQVAEYSLEQRKEGEENKKKGVVRKFFFRKAEHKEDMNENR